MNTLKNNILILLAIIFPFLGCVEQQKKKATSNQEIEVKENSTTVFFINKFNKEPIYNFRFGRYFNREELPTELILDRDSFGLVEKTYICIPYQSLNRDDSIFGYFEKNGFKAKEFYINPKKNKQIIEIEPNPSELIIRAIDEEFINNFDSIRVAIEKNNREENFEKNKKVKIIKEEFSFAPNQVSKDLSIFNYYIYPNDNLKIELEVYSKLKSYKSIYTVNYQPFTKTILLAY